MSQELKELYEEYLISENVSKSVLNITPELLSGDSSLFLTILPFFRSVQYIHVLARIRAP